jgi:hypothetical protein
MQAAKKGKQYVGYVVMKAGHKCSRKKLMNSRRLKFCAGVCENCA